MECWFAGGWWRSFDRNDYRRPQHPYRDRSVAAENYQVQVLFPNSGSTACTGGPGNPSGTGTISGIVYFNGGCLSTTQTLFLPAGPIPLVAYPYPGWVFYGWQINNQFILSSSSSYSLTSPATITPLFSIAKRVHFMTNPPGLNVLVDRSTSQTPMTPSPNGATCPTTSSQLSGLAPLGFAQLCTGDFDFLPGSVHTIGANTPQTDQVGNYWVFEGYTNGIGQNGSYTVDNATNVATTLTAGFVPGVKVTLITSQPGLQLSGRRAQQLAGLQLRLGAGRDAHRQRCGDPGGFQRPDVVVRKLVQRRTGDPDVDHAHHYYEHCADGDFLRAAAGDHQQRAVGHAVFSGRECLRDALRGEQGIGRNYAGGSAGVGFVELGFTARPDVVE